MNKLHIQLFPTPERIFAAIPTRRRRIVLSRSHPSRWPPTVFPKGMGKAHRRSLDKEDHIFWLPHPFYSRSTTPISFPYIKTLSRLQRDLGYRKRDFIFIGQTRHRRSSTRLLRFPFPPLHRTQENRHLTTSP